MNEVQTARKLALLLEAARTIGAELDIGVVLQRLMQLTHAHLQPDAVSVASVEADGSLLFRAASGGAAEEIVGIVMNPGEGIAGWVAQQAEPLWVPDVSKDQRFFGNIDRVTGFHTTAILAVPVRMGDQTLAVLEMINPQPETGLDEAIEVMKALASIAAPALQNARLFEQVRRAEIRYQSLFELNLDPLVIISHEGKLLEANRAAKQLLGITADSLECVSLETLGLTLDEFARHKSRLASGEVVMWELQLDGTRPRILEVSLSSLPHYSLGGAYQWIGHDITDRVALEETRQQLANMIVHDLRAPLGSILNSLELTLTAWREKDLTLPVEQVLQIGLRSAHRMDRLIGNILDTARLKTKEKAISVSAIDVHLMIADVVETVGPALRHRGHTLTQNVPEELPTMDGDHDLLRRALINILSNAVKYTQPNGSITLTVSLNEEAFTFCVADNGPGIPKEDQPHIFELFFRGRSQKTRGIGIGLSFCKLAIEAHGGRIWLESEPGKGATFCFSIPRVLTPNGLLLYEDSR